MVLFWLYAATVIGTVFPPRLLSPVWQLAFSGSVITNAPLALVGLALLHLAGHLDPANPILARRRSTCARLASLAVAGFLLLVPLQVQAIGQTLKSREQVQNRQLGIAERRIADVRRAIASARTVEQLQAELARLKVGTLTVKGTPGDRSLTGVREQLLSSLEGSRSSLQSQYQNTTTGMIWAFLQSSLQGIVSAIALAFGFAALAQRGEHGISLLEEFRRMVSQLRVPFPWPRSQRRGIHRNPWRQP
jgi:hypothetical protein